MNENYKILGVSENATDEEITTAYQNLRAKYSQERFLEGEAGNKAAKNLTNLQIAYDEIMRERKYSSDGAEKNYTFEQIETMIKDGDLNQAQNALDSFSERGAEWHYLQAVVFYKKNWHNESKKQLEIALNIDPDNEKYKDSYKKLNQKIEFTQNQFHSGNANFGSGSDGGANRQMGGDSCGSFAECLATFCCVNALCNCCR